MLQTHSLALNSLHRPLLGSRPVAPKPAPRSQVVRPSQRSLEAVCESLPSDLSANKKAMINRLVALYEQGALG